MSCTLPACRACLPVCQATAPSARLQFDVVGTAGALRRRALSAAVDVGVAPLGKRKVQPTLLQSASALQGLPGVVAWRTRDAMFFGS